MALCSFKAAAVRFSGSSDGAIGYGNKGVSCFCSSPFLRLPPTKSKDSSILRCDLKGKLLWVADRKLWTGGEIKAPSPFHINAQASICLSRAQRWWEKTLKPNMVEIRSAQQLIDSLKAAGDRLAVVDFYSPGCGGCRALHPKICQLAEENPDVIFLKVNYEELKNMCHSLHVHVLPFFRFYRGADGRRCSFSCTNATIKKFKDALAKHGGDRCSLGPAKGLEESELTKLAAAGEISVDPPLSSPAEREILERVLKNSGVGNRTGRLAEARNLEEVAFLKVSGTK